MRANDSFDQLVEQHRNEIIGYLTRMLGDAQDAEDVYQDAVLRAYRAYARLRPDSNARAWLYKIATRVAFNALKRRRRERSRMTDMDLDTLAVDATLSIEQREQLRSVARAVEALPPKQRAALMQRQFQGLSYAEIAQTLGGSQAAARANVYQALRKLRLALGDE